MTMVDTQCNMQLLVFENRSLLHSQALETCSLPLKVQALHAYAPSVHYFGLFRMLRQGYKDPNTRQQPYVLQ